jgi:hypothetical protein
MAVTISEIHRIDANGARRVLEVYPPEDRVTPVCLHLSDPDLEQHVLELDVVVRHRAPFRDAPVGHRPDFAGRHRDARQRNYFTSVGLEETLAAILEGLPHKGVPRYEVRQRVQRTKY